MRSDHAYQAQRIDPRLFQAQRWMFLNLQIVCRSVQRLPDHQWIPAVPDFAAALLPAVETTSSTRPES